MKLSISLLLLFLSSVGNSFAAGSVQFPWKDPGKARVECRADSATLRNKMFSASFKKSGSGVVFDGFKQSNGKQVASSGTSLFTISLDNGTSYTSNQLSSSDLEAVSLSPSKSASRLSCKIPGEAVRCTFTTPGGELEIQWQAVLRDSSHYLRQEFVIKALKDTKFSNIRPLEYVITRGGVPRLSGGTTHGKVAMNELVFCGVETPMSLMHAAGGESSGSPAAEWSPHEWNGADFTDAFHPPAKLASVYTRKEGPIVKGIKRSEGQVNFTQQGNCEIRFSGNPSIVAVQIIPEGSETIAAEDVHPLSRSNKYKVMVPAPGRYTLRIWADTRKSDIQGSGSISYSIPLADDSSQPDNSGGENGLVTGDWVRNATLHKDKTWEVSTVLGFFAPKQQRRSFLAYLERERAVPYRLFIHYNDWYEIGITRNNNEDPLKRNSEALQLQLLADWKREMLQKRKTPIDAFVIDDGWDDFNSLWDFHKGFPNGFSKIDRALRGMKSGLGTWLGPVGGYGHAKGCRLGFWNKNHPDNQIGNFQLSNQEYFDAFVGRCSQMVKDYRMRYFKFDGISAQFHAKGPGNLEDAEGIISVLRELRKARNDIFINTTVGTWSSPFWLHFADSTWRQENDFGMMGDTGDNRDKWMTYRDRLIHEVFVQRSPLYPLNSLMTHGIIITRNGPPNAMPKDPQNCLKEIRSHVGCGTCLQELYVDRELLDQENGRLWNELAEAIKWLRRNEDVLADIHWVGGNPWDQDANDGDIYGWAAWNPYKCTLTLRNSGKNARTLTATLREILDIPPSVKKDKITFRSSFRGQPAVPALLSGAVDIDEPLKITLQAQDVVVLEGESAAGRKLKKEAANAAGESGDEESDSPPRKKKKGAKGKKKRKK